MTYTCSRCGLPVEGLYAKGFCRPCYYIQYNEKSTPKKDIIKEELVG